MGGTFVVTLREGFEASLILGIIYTYLHQIGATHHSRWVTVGALLGIGASAALGVGVSVLSGPLLDLGPDLIATVVVFVAVGVLTWHGWWMRRHGRAVKGEVLRRIDRAEGRQQLAVLGLIAFTAVFREGAETILFVWGLMSQAATMSAWGGLAGAVLGILGAAFLGWLVFSGGTRISISRFFAITSVLLLVVAAGLFSGGVGRLEGLGVLPSTGPLWDTSWLVSDEGLVGSLLTGLIGYHARPSALEVIAYGLYLAVAGTMLFGDALGGALGRDKQDAAPAAVSADEIR